MNARKESELLFALFSYSLVLRSEQGALNATHLQRDNVKTAKDTVQLEKKKKSSRTVQSTSYFSFPFLTYFPACVVYALILAVAPCHLSAVRSC